MLAPETDLVCFNGYLPVNVKARTLKVKARTLLSCHCGMIRQTARFIFDRANTGSNLIKLANMRSSLIEE